MSQRIDPNAIFEVGARVRLVWADIDDHAIAGQVGTVVESAMVPWVMFDEPTGQVGGPGPGPHLAWKEGYMDVVAQDQLELTDVPAPAHDEDIEVQL